MAISWNESARVCGSTANSRLYAAALYATAAATVLIWWTRDAPGPPQLTHAVLLTTGALAAAELRRQVEWRVSADTPAGPVRVDVDLACLVPIGLLCGPAAAGGAAVALHATDRFRLPGARVRAPVEPDGPAAAVLANVTGAVVYRQVVGSPADVLPHTWLAGLGATLATAVVILFGHALRAAGALLADTRVATPPDVIGMEVAAAGLGICVAALVTVNPVLLPAAIGLAPTLYRAPLASHYRNRARIDPKTGLANPARWRELAERELRRAVRLAEPVSVLMIDLDHFKRVNDRHGHLAGDAVLHAVAVDLVDRARAYDLVGRYGGEEFEVLLPRTDAAGAVVIAERFRRSVAALRVGSGPAGSTVRVTVSIGAATWVPGGPRCALDDLLDRADQALYRAKAAGRDRVEASVGG